MARRKLSEDDVPRNVARAFEKIELAGQSKDSEPIDFVDKPVKQADGLYELKLTPLQRQSLLRCVRLTAKLKKMLTDAGNGTKVIRLTQKEIDRLTDRIVLGGFGAPSVDMKRLAAVLRKIADINVFDLDERFEDEAPARRRPAVKPGDALYQFKVALRDIKPPIWRRILVPDGTLLDLHHDIQAAFGWEDYHLHQFTIKGVRYSVPSPYDDDFEIKIHDETQVRLSELIPQSTRSARWVYEYDFGDGWRHEVVFEKFATAEAKTKYPLCVDGQRACPPEDCGGPWGYLDFLKAIKNPRHENHQDMLDWGGPFDPEEFDAAKATREMRQAR